MAKGFTWGLFPIAMILSAASLSAEEETTTVETVTVSVPATFQSFTGKITRNRVRLRTGASVESGIVREMDRGDYLVVSGETNDFYEVMAPADTRAYIFRTFVLDDIVEGDRVNVRLRPDLEAPIVAQLNTGDRVDGHISDHNKKWLEINPPEGTRFYVAKEYIEYAGDTTLLAKMEEERQEVQNLLNTAFLVSQTELQKPFEEINLQHAIANFEKVIHDYEKFEDQAAKAREGLGIIQEAYFQRKIAYLEERTEQVTENWATRNQGLTEQLENYKANLGRLEERLREESGLPLTLVDYTEETTENTETASLNIEPVTGYVSDVGTAWLAQEQGIFRSWAESNVGSESDFYSQEDLEGETLTGILRPYERNVRNKPGDYVLVDERTRLPVAYVYSTRVDLDSQVGQRVSVVGSIRPNNHFAYPAYHVSSIE